MEPRVEFLSYPDFQLRLAAMGIVGTLIVVLSCILGVPYHLVAVLAEDLYRCMTVELLLEGSKKEQTP